MAAPRSPIHTEQLTPEDIRRIREGLGLTQVEAGELLGGGPRAFTKYESGTIKPAAAVANLLRVLEAEPQALATLAGPRATPLDSETHRPLEVTADHIKVLSPRKARGATARGRSAGQWAPHARYSRRRTDHRR
jgi:transcriptional regulator with XRE-family HTH domain